VVLDVEMRELGITAGLQDRVVQVYGGTVHMDFTRDMRPTLGLSEGTPIGDYKLLEISNPPAFYLVYCVRQGMLGCTEWEKAVPNRL